MRWFIALIFLASAALSAPPVQHFRDTLANVWETGGVCRHAAVVVCAEAMLHGMPCVMPYWNVNEELGHVIPAIYHPESKKWHAIDYFRAGPYSRTMAAPPKNCREAEAASPYNCREFLGFAEEREPERVTGWFGEAIFFGYIDPERYLDEGQEESRTP